MPTSGPAEAVDPEVVTRLSEQVRRLQLHVRAARRRERRAPPAPPAAPAERTMPQFDPPAQLLMHQMMQRSPAPGTKFYLVEVPEDADPRVAEFDSADALTIAIRSALGRASFLFPFMGSHLTISRGDHKYLKTPFGVLPLFVIPSEQELEFDGKGWVGPSNSEPQIPDRPSEAGPKFVVSASQEDDEDDDDGDVPSDLDEDDEDDGDELMPR